MEDVLIEVCKLPVDEWRDYKQLRLDALQNSPQAFSATYAQNVERPDSFWQSRLEEASRGYGHWLFFAKMNKRLVGMIGAFTEEDDPQMAHIISVYVIEEARGRGISKMLMSAILSELKKEGLRKAKLGVNTKQIPAIKLYQQFGFRTVQKISHLLMGDGEYHDEFLMEKDLFDGS